MRFVALMLAVAALAAGIGLVPVTPVQAHGGDGGGQLGVDPSRTSCEAVTAEDDAAAYTSCGDSHDKGKL